ncbi:MAG: hypothetical protein N2512_07345, partial [Armatimonadetes bacterium]|nr:hypothetical protein [Armatimonadota bacterium]
RARASARHRRWTVRMAFVVLLLPLLMALQRSWAGLIVSTPRVGRVFFPGESVNVALRLDSATPNGTASYKVTDYLGKVVATGQLPLRQDQAATLRLGKLSNGWYRMDITLPDGWQHVDAVCVLPPMTDSGRHYRLFGVCATLDSQDRMDFLSYAGIRTIRRDWGWPTIEPTEGQWSPQYTTTIMNYAAEAGMEFIPIIGYSPRFVGVKPLDATSGRPSIAWHTWPMADETKWVRFLNWCKDFAARFGPVYWPPYRLAPNATTRQKLDPIIAWEVWNEADQNYYYGPWHQYCDLLKMAYGVLDDLARPVIYGGSCGHWTEVGMAYSYGARNFFDLAAGHAGHEPDSSLADWLYGAYSIGYRYGLPYELVFTEGYFKDEATGVPPPLFVLPMTAKLRHWGFGWHYKGIAWEASASPDFSTDQYCFYQSYGIVPTPSYLATAVARYWLTDAAYVGRLKLNGDTETFVWLRDEAPTLLLWKPSGAGRLAVKVAAGAKIVDFLGQQTAAGGPGQISVDVGPAPRLLVGADWSYVADALDARLQEFQASQFGAQPPTGKWCPYIGTIDADLQSIGGETYLAAVRKTRVASAAMRAKPRDAYTKLFDAVTALCNVLTHIAASSSGDSSDDKRFNALWRIQAIAEWLAEVGDALGAYFGQPKVANYQLAATASQVSAAWCTSVDHIQGLERPRARSLARRAAATLALTRATKGRTLRLVASAEATAASLWAQREKPLNTRVLGFAAFPDSAYVVKGQLLDPSRQQRVWLYLYNATTKPVTAKVKVAFPEGWRPAAAEAVCTAQPGTIVMAGEVVVTLPSEEPWQTKNAWRPDCPLTVLCPAGLPANQVIDVWAETGTAASPKAGYYFAIGKVPQ